MKEEEIDKGDGGPPTREVFSFFEILSDLNQAVPNHLAGGRMVRWCVRLTRLTLVCKVIRYRLVQVQQNLKKKMSTLIFAMQKLSLLKCVRL